MGTLLRVLVQSGDGESLTELALDSAVMSQTLPGQLLEVKLVETRLGWVEVRLRHVDPTRLDAGDPSMTAYEHGVQDATAKLRKNRSFDSGDCVR